MCFRLLPRAVLSLIYLPTFTAYYGNIEERHNGTINTLFCDGHVKSIKLDAITQANANGLFTAACIKRNPS